MTASKNIQNPETILSNKSQFNDRDIISEALSTEKFLCQSYAIAIHDVSHNKLYNQIFSMLDDTSKQQRNFFDLMFQHGWHSITPADASEISALEQQFTENKQQLQ